MQGRQQSVKILTELVRETVGQLEGDGVYTISVASRLVEMHPNTLRKYETAGLLNPNRTAGKQRLYSRDDIERLLLIRRLVERYNQTTRVIGLLVEMVRTLERVEAYLRNEPTLSASPEARKLANYINKQLKMVDLE